jgi:hypothetical protein
MYSSKTLSCSILLLIFIHTVTNIFSCLTLHVGIWDNLSILLPTVDMFSILWAVLVWTFCAFLIYILKYIFLKSIKILLSHMFSYINIIFNPFRHSQQWISQKKYLWIKHSYMWFFSKLDLFLFFNLHVSSETKRCFPWIFVPYHIFSSLAVLMFQIIFYFLMFKKFR